MPTFEYRHRVRYRECDPMGIVYHTHYLDYLEAARTEALRDLGLPYLKIEETGIIMPVVDLALRYVRPARYDDLICVTSIFEDRLPGVKVRIDYKVHRDSDDELLVTGHVTLACVDRESGRPTSPPQLLLDAFRQAINGQPPALSD